MNESNTKNGATTKGTVLSRLRAVRLRPTIARIGVLQVLEMQAPKHLDAETVFRDLIGRGVHLSHGTTYRVLKDLVSRGLATQEWRTGLSGSKAVYCAVRQGSSASDFCIVCKRCDNTMAITDSALREQLQQLVLRQGLSLALQPMTILADCTRCSNRSTSGFGSGRARNCVLEPSEAGALLEAL
ncbi:Ferric uptake regulation protein FUR [Klebsiella pneumoniae]|uniref:Ferric uptake regulation protein FUR n=1 Tax=Klebsiella pneumoniae TaxID=573 RepID=A0A378A3Z7_KLEPN|nr:Ferric uptake regulation protein FUR [Klebsiella pneumoniae]STU31067.1 Ferric uptake regulation protein FUR [Klebsiella pneumoniae]STU50864.1 Ferric uptake regulation protein FUR [Klebsiella pneumoniae]STU93923.1 Ferric uptake regulation protein FUR [Klebsiella pneumoniae]